jgi:hypothetical protein
VSAAIVVTAFSCFPSERRPTNIMYQTYSTTKMERGTGAGGWRASKRGPGEIVREPKLKLNLDIEEMEKGRVTGVRLINRKRGQRGFYEG